MPIKTRHTQKRISIRRSFRTRPSNQTAIVCVDHPDVQLFYEDEWDDHFPLRSPPVRKHRKPKPAVEEIIPEDEEEHGVEDESNCENVDPFVDDRIAFEELKAQLAEAEEYSLYIENSDGVRLKPVGNELVDYESYTGHKSTANVFPKRNKPAPPDQAEINAKNHELRKAVWAYLRSCTPPPRKRNSTRLSVFVAGGTSFRRDSAAIERIRRTTHSIVAQPIEETPETEATEAASTRTSAYHQDCAPNVGLSVTPKSRLQSMDGRKQKSNLLTASFLNLEPDSEPVSSTRECEISFSSICGMDLQEPVHSSTPMQKCAPQARSTPFDQVQESSESSIKIAPERTSESSPRWANVTERSKERTLSRLSRTSSPGDAPLSPALRGDSFEESGSRVIIVENPLQTADNSVFQEAAKDNVANRDDEDQLSSLLETSLDLSLHMRRSEHYMSFSSMGTLAEDAPFQTTRNADMSRNVTQMTTNNTRNLTHLTNASFIDIPFYLYGYANAATATPLQQLLHVIGQSEVFEWKGLPEDVLENPKKLGEGVYGEVFATTYKGQPTALKVIPFHGDKIVYDGKVNGEYLLDAAGILPEILINRELSALYDPSADCSTPNFIQLLKTNVVRGQYPDTFLRAWDEFDEAKESENDRPTEYASDEQLFVTIGMAMGGLDLEHYKMKNEDQVISTLLQIAISLVVAEERLEFEHRDLHVGNVLVLEEDADLEYKVFGGTMILRSYGVKVNLIDFTLSRMRKEGTTIFRDLEADEELFVGTGDYQFDIYRMMRHENQGDWLSFTPKTNCFWLHYLSKQLISKQKCKKAIPKKRREALQTVWDQLLGFDSIRDIFTNDDFIEVLERHLIVKSRPDKA